MKYQYSALFPDLPRPLDLPDKVYIMIGYA